MNSKIVIFDSGAGGISFVKELLTLYLNLSFIYLADQKHFPYGEKSNSFLLNRMKNIIKFLDKYSPKAIVLACNTATSHAINKLRQITNTALIGVEPVIKPLSNYKNPLLLATKTTCQSSRTHELISQFAPQKITTHTPKNLAAKIEKNQNEKIQKTLKELAENFPHKDAIGLSCTHYLLIKDRFKKHFPDAKIIDPTKAVIRRIQEVTNLQNSPNPQENWYTTGSVIRLKQQVKTYLKKKVEPKRVKI